MYILRLTVFAFVLTVCWPLRGQRYIQADPFYLMLQEQTYFHNGENYGSLMIRPLFKPWHNPGSNWTVTVRSELFNNTSSPNLENSSDRWIGKGRSFFSSFNISYSGKFIAFSLEPFYFANQNKTYEPPLRIGQYSKLNDNRPHSDSPYNSSGFRESQLYLHYKGVGLGISNANMWWGPGIHSSLNMTNNARGFNHLMVGTVSEQRIKNVGFDIRYIFSKLDTLNTAEPFFTALVLVTTIHSDPVLTVGLSRTYLSGGNRIQEEISLKEAMLLPFRSPFLIFRASDTNVFPNALDIWDQTLVGYVCATFPSSGLKVFVEYGRNNQAWDGKDLRRQPDHSAASVIGLRKYGLFGRKYLTAGIEYANLIMDRFRTKRKSGNWYDRKAYDFTSYDGRHWAAHSGPDSDDFTIYLGYLGERFSFIPAFNYERHGVIDNRALVLVARPYLVYDHELGIWVPKIRREERERQLNIWPEVKFEFRLDIRYVFKGLRFNVYYEREVVHNLGFKGGERRGSVIWLGVERHFDDLKFPGFLSRL